jgi:hypothetical protein
MGVYISVIPRPANSIVTWEIELENEGDTMSIDFWVNGTAYPSYNMLIGATNNTKITWTAYNNSTGAIISGPTAVADYVAPIGAAVDYHFTFSTQTFTFSTDSGDLFTISNYNNSNVVLTLSGSDTSTVQTYVGEQALTSSSSSTDACASLWWPWLVLSISIVLLIAVAGVAFWLGWRHRKIAA